MSTLDQERRRSAEGRFALISAGYHVIPGERGFEDAIRNAISLGGDSDTIAAITGSIAEAAYGIPDWIRDEAIMRLDPPLRDVLSRWNQFVSRYHEISGGNDKLYPQ